MVLYRSSLLLSERTKRMSGLCLKALKTERKKGFLAPHPHYSTSDYSLTSPALSHYSHSVFFVFKMVRDFESDSYGL
jgi:hypothetical protein